jgi:hypothetical protein
MPMAEEFRKDGLPKSEYDIWIGVIIEPTTQAGTSILGVLNIYYQTTVSENLQIPRLLAEEVIHEQHDVRVPIQASSETTLLPNIKPLQMEKPSGKPLRKKDSIHSWKSSTAHFSDIPHHIRHNME